MSRAHFVNRATLRFQNGVQLTDQLSIVVVEMSKLGYALKKPVEDIALAAGFTAGDILRQ